MSLESEKLLMVSQCATGEEVNDYICPEGSSSVSPYLYKLQDDMVGSFISMCLV